MSVNRELKELVEQLCGCLQNVSDQSGFGEEMEGVVKMELAMYMMYLSASDGEISWEEANTISEICDISLTPSGLGDFIRENNIYSTTFEEEAPLCLKMMVAADNCLVEAGQDIAETSGSRVLINVYKSIGDALMNADGRIDDNEVRDRNIFLRMLEEYREENCIGVKKSTLGFTKNSKSVTAPVKSGVAAPRKGK